MAYSVNAVRLLCEIRFPSGTMRLWAGSGPMVAAGYVWRGIGAVEGLDQIERARNAEGARLDIGLQTQEPGFGDMALSELDDTIGTVVKLYRQKVDSTNTPIGSLKTIATRKIANIVLSDEAHPLGVISRVVAQTSNRFAQVRNLADVMVLSTASHSVEHLGDLFYERKPLLQDHWIKWPRFT